MSIFEKSRRADSEFSQDYRDEANVYLPFRSRFIEISKSIYKNFIPKNIETKILDLGCGDGLFIQELLKSVIPLKVTLIDGSTEMLEAAKKRLAGQKNIHFVQSSFQNLIKLEKCYLSLWREWIKEHSVKEGHEKLLGIPDQYNGNPDNIPDTLESQLEALKDVGFSNVDCFSKYRIFSLFGGSK